MTYSDLESRSRFTIHTPNLWLFVGNIHAKYYDPSFIIWYYPSYHAYCDIRSMTFSDLESRSRSTIHVTELELRVRNIDAKHEDPSFIIT
jgi:hypothetical protein